MNDYKNLLNNITELKSLRNKEYICKSQRFQVKRRKKRLEREVQKQIKEIANRQAKNIYNATCKLYNDMLNKED